MGIEDIKKSICETPEEEENRDEKTWDERLLQRQMDSRGDLIIPDSDLALIEPHDCRTPWDFGC